MHPVQSFFKKIAEATWFVNFITWVIIAAGVVVGAQTYPGLVAKYGGILDVLDSLILWIFVAEVLIKMAAHGKRPWRYFLDPWNVFDFIIVAACFLPIGSQYAMVLRLARLLRVLKLVRALPKLQVLVGALLKSIPSIGYISILLFMLFYLYAVTGTFLFSENDPIHFGNLQTSMLSLFRAVTLEDWTDLMYIQMAGCADYGYGGLEHLCTASKASPIVGSAFFVSFILVGTMIVLNLFIGVIMNGMDEARAEADALDEKDRLSMIPEGEVPTLADDLKDLESKLAELQQQIVRMTTKASELKPAEAKRTRSRIPKGP
ncbi:MAG: ion transporter [Deltaproteobacteria bacterium]|nr:ion transporter [Deltaproteobacteria bacterium]